MATTYAVHILQRQIGRDFASHEVDNFTARLCGEVKGGYQNGSVIQIKYQTRLARVVEEYLDYFLVESTLEDKSE